MRMQQKEGRKEGAISFQEDFFHAAPSHARLSVSAPPACMLMPNYVCRVVKGGAAPARSPARLLTIPTFGRKGEDNQKTTKKKKKSNAYATNSVREMSKMPLETRESETDFCCSFDSGGIGRPHHPTPPLPDRSWSSSSSSSHNAFA